jgi:uncharacterized protein (TIGR02145 family)
MEKVLLVLKGILPFMFLTIVSCSGPSEKKSTKEDVTKTEVVFSKEDEGAPKAKERAVSIKINKQEWMPANLKTSTFRNGESIFEAKTAQEWQEKTNAGQPACCFAEFNPDNGKIYGRLYNWFAVSDARGLCPDGWRVPTDKDFKELRIFLGDDDGNKLKSDDPKFWKQVEREFINESGFGGLPGGAVTFEGVFVQIGASGFWWTATENEQDSKRSTAYYLGLMDGQIDAIRRPYDKQLGFSVRCMKN